jgi:hypothetical protein
MKRIGLLLLGGVLLAACSPATPVKSFTKGDQLAYYDFSQGGSFEEGTYADGTVRLQIKDGKYDVTLIEGDNELWYTQWGEPQRDVVVDVDAKQATQSENTAYGVVCRMRGLVGQTVEADPALEAMAVENQTSTSLIASADATAEATEAAEATEEATAEATADSTSEATAEATEASTEEATVEAPEAATEEATAEATEAPTEGAPTVLNTNNGDGYLFLIEGNGRFAIMRSQGRSVTPLVNWTASSVIKTGAADNRIRAVCLGDYLAMYVNGTFVGDATDDTYSTGQVGLAGAAASRLGLQVTFDNLTVSGATE